MFINSRDAASAQIFTLIHELAHIWLNLSGISNPDPIDDRNQKLEKFCNRVAAEALVPEDDFLAAWEQVVDKEFFPTSLSRTFWVSPLVIIVRAFELNKISDKEFARFVAIEKNKKPRPPKKRKGGNPTQNILARNSRRLTLAVLSALRSNTLVHRDAAWILGIKRKGLTALFNELASK